MSNFSHEFLLCAKIDFASQYPLVAIVKILDIMYEKNTENKKPSYLNFW